MPLPTAPTVEQLLAFAEPADITLTHIQGFVVTDDYFVVTNTDVGGVGVEAEVQLLDRANRNTEAQANSTILADIAALGGGAPTDITHIGSPVVVGTDIFVPVSDRPTLSKWGIIKLDIATLTVQSYQSLSLTQTGGTDPDAAGLAYDPDNDEFYLCTYDTEDLYVIAGENHATNSYGAILSKTDMGSGYTLAQAIKIALNDQGEKRLYWARAGTATQRVSQLDGTDDTTWHAAQGVVSDAATIDIAEGFFWVLSSSGYRKMGPEFGPTKPGTVNYNSSHDHVAAAVAFWPLTEGSGTSIADLVNGIDLTIQNQDVSDGNWTSGGLHFAGRNENAKATGVDSDVLVAGTGDPLENGITVEAVITVENDSTAGHRGLISLGDSATSPVNRVGFIPRRNATGSPLAIWDNLNTWDQVQSTRPQQGLPLGQKLHVMWVWNETDVAFYVNGELYDVAARSGIPAVTGHIALGTSNVSDSTEQFDGIVDMVRIHSKTDWTAAEISDMAQNPYAALSGGGGGGRGTFQGVLGTGLI